LPALLAALPFAKTVALALGGTSAGLARSMLRGLGLGFFASIPCGGARGCGLAGEATTRADEATPWPAASKAALNSAGAVPPGRGHKRTCHPTRVRQNMFLGSPQRREHTCENGKGVEQLVLSHAKAEWREKHMYAFNK